MVGDDGATETLNSKHRIEYRSAVQGRPSSAELTSGAKRVQGDVATPVRCHVSGSLRRSSAAAAILYSKACFERAS